IRNYGVWVGRPTRFIAQSAHQDHTTPHINLFLRDGSEDADGFDREIQAAINVKSTQADTRLVFWFIRDFAHHPFVHHLADLDPGFHRIKPHSDNDDGDEEEDEVFNSYHARSYHHRYNQPHHPTLPGLDYLRTTPQLLDLEAGRLLPHDIPGNDNDMLDELEPILKDAIHRRATAYVFGSAFGGSGGCGIHDVHMNQGSRKTYEDAVHKDGGMVFRFEDGRWEAVFLAFASQVVPTDYRG
ncbi:YukJ family protein, partial [Aspergillus homomorphus CBS 101889]